MVLRKYTDLKWSVKRESHRIVEIADEVPKVDAGDVFDSGRGFLPVGTSAGTWTGKETQERRHVVRPLHNP